MKEVAFRFFQYSSTSEYITNDKAEFITAFVSNCNCGDYVNMFKNLIGSEIKLKDKWYTIEEVAATFGGGKGDNDIFCVDIYCL